MASNAVPSLLREYDAEELATDPSLLVALDRDGTILWLNEAWTRFALENGGENVLARFGPGTSYLSGVDPTLRGFFATAFGNVLLTGEPFELDYECSSAHLFRLFHMLVLPIRREGLLVVHSRLVERPHDRTGGPGIEALYRQPSGIIVQCANCRRVRRADGSGWDWVPEWVENVPEQTSHGICAFCRAYYWGRRTKRPKSPLAH